MYGIFAYMYCKYQLNVGKYSCPMDSMGGNPYLDFQESVDGLVQLDQNQSSCFKYVGCLLCNVEEYS